MKNEKEREALNTKYEDQLQSLQQGAQEIHEMRQQMQECDVTNIIHSAKIARMAEAHARRAKSCMEGLRSEARKVKSEHNSSKKLASKTYPEPSGTIELNRWLPWKGVETHIVMAANVGN